MDIAFRIDIKCACILIFLLLSTLLTSIDASIHIYQKQLFNEVGNAYLLPGGSEGLDASLSSDDSATDGRSFIWFENITFWRTQDAAYAHSEMEHSTGLIQVVIFEAADRNNIGGSAYGGQRSICCTPDLAKLEGWKQGEVIRIPSATEIDWPIVLNIQFSGNDLSTDKANAEVPIKKTGMYNLFFIVCDPKLKGTVMSGKTVWKNPDGYLPGRMAPLMKFCVHGSCLFVSQCTLVLAIRMRPVVLTAWVVTVGALKKTLSRLLILSVSMGYGVVRPTLGGLTSKVLLIGATYFVASELLDITEHVGTINDLSGRARLFLALPDAFLDAFLILWIFTSLSKTLEQLQAKRISVKLDLYRKF
ncbi:hypothetical protein F3Y22_tig00110391pilonHSYRG00117 [Hibiscus syriacus]|uniref:GOST seven transmembrane domain-containing protein n=1 Tax=Hibiscus syriacus TaxID=106335 RepID=A0A6A3AUS7_HIBSY|nr:hypothetical protein F3Y22_tig00110391pilonHSYRG00117 [Hibiscus syriacus]